MPALKKIDSSSFRGCGSLESFSSNLFTIGYGAIYKRHTELIACIADAVDFEVPEGVTFIGSNAIPYDAYIFTPQSLKTWQAIECSKHNKLLNYLRHHLELNLI